MRGIVVVGAACVAMGLAACGPQKATAEASAAAEPAGVEAKAGRPDPREAPAPLAKDGKPIWSANRDRTAEENAQAAFQRNGEAFGAANVDDFVEKAHAFTAHPPRGAEILKRSNGDTLIYDAKSNTFAVVTKDGAPRTMFHPDDGPAYWAEQKDREVARAPKGKAKKTQG